MSAKPGNAPATTSELRKIKRVQFGVLGPDEIRNMSVAEIKYATLLDNGVPKESGLLDLRLGTTERNFVCKTCNGSAEQCPGHFGHIELAKPVFHIGFMPYILKILRCVCYHCSELLLPRDSIKFREVAKIINGHERLSLFSKFCSSKTVCGTAPEEVMEADGANEGAHVRRGGCGNYQPKYRRHGVKITAEFSDKVTDMDPTERKKELTPEKVWSIFKRISDENCVALGLNPTYARPDWFVLTVLPVSPPPVRPSVMMDSVNSSQDDITHQLATIVQLNERLKREESRGIAHHLLKETYDLLQYAVVGMMDNEIASIPRAQQRSGRPIKSIRQRIVGKGGRVRGNLMGKRVDYSARSVITCDPTLNLDQLGVPRSVAMNLTCPEIVTDLNRDRLQRLVDNGASQHPGAKLIIRPDGKSIDLRFAKSSEKQLQVGMVVDRHLMDNDVVIFNRQPSLHKMSMMGHRVRVLPYSTFRLNLSVTTPYNADFDGDEMNMHVPQTFEGRAEVAEIMMVPRQIVSPQSNRPVMGIVQDTLLGCFKFTQRDTFMSYDVVMNALMWLETWDGRLPMPAVLRPEPMWTGKQIFSLLLPKINIQGESNVQPDGDKDPMTPVDGLVLIENGELISGIIDKKTIGNVPGAILHTIWLEYGPEICKIFMSQVQTTVNYWLLQNGFTVGVGDIVSTSNILDNIKNMIINAKKSVFSIINAARSNKLEPTPGRSYIETFEYQVNNELNDAVNKAGKAVRESLDRSNNLVSMVNAGSKGNNVNISQIIATVGQQNVSGKRLPFGFRGRSLPHFSKDDLGPESRGFVTNSYVQGLTPQEFFFHAMGGREGLIDTAVKTSETGYIQRRFVKAMEDMIVRYDGTVRNSLDEPVQFAYGEDGIDATFIEKQKFSIVKMDNHELERVYRLDLATLSDADTWIDPTIRDELSQRPEVHRKLAEEFETIRRDRDYLRKYLFPTYKSDQMYVPCNINRLIWNAQRKFDILRKASTYSNLSPEDIVDRVRALCDKLIVFHGTDALTREAQENSTLLFRILLRSSLAAKRVLKDFRLNKAAFDYILGEIEARFQQAVVAPGEAVGTIAAQSLGEPTTQMTLNTFHLAGVAAKNVTSGVPRLREIINVAQKLKTPGLTIFLQPEYSVTSDQALKVRSKLEHVALKDIVARTEIYYDPNPLECVVEIDRSWVYDYFFIEEEKISQLSPWLLRIEIDAKKIADKKLTLKQIADRINTDYGGSLLCIHNNDNAQVQSLHVRLVETSADGEDGEDDKKDSELEEGETFLRTIESKLLRKTVLSGITNIKKVYVRKEKVTGFNNDGSYFDNKSEFCLETDGVNLLAVMNVPEVDHRRTTSNHVIEIFRVLGIEACRAAVLNEIRAVFEGSSYINYRHLAMLVETMTYRGHLMSVTRHGINRIDTGPLMRCSFEETVEILVQAAAFAETSKLTAVSENILVGNLAPFGTGAFDIFLDEEAVKTAINPNLIAQSGYLSGPQFGFPMDVAGSHTPVYNASPLSTGSATPTYGNTALSPLMGAQFSPVIGSATPKYAASSTAFTPVTNFAATTPRLGFNSTNYSPTTPGNLYSPTSPAIISPTSPTFSPQSGNYSPTSPQAAYSPTSPKFSPTSGGGQYSPTSPAFSPTSGGAYSPTSPQAQYSPTSPGYSPTSPQGAYSPTSPQGAYSPTSPQGAYSPTSPGYSPTSPQAGGAYSPTSPAYSPTSPKASSHGAYSPTSPNYSPASPAFSPTSPARGSNTFYSPTSPNYSPVSPSANKNYSPTSPNIQSPVSPVYSPTSPQHEAADDDRMD